MRFTRVIGLSLTLFLVVVLTTTALAAQGDTTLISLSSDEVQADYGGTYPAISPDGRFVAFRSGATNLVSGDNNTYTDVFVRDRQAGTTVRVSVTSGGGEGDWDSGSPAISADGRFVVFPSDSTNLVVDDNNNRMDVFVHDRDTDEDGIFDEAGFISTTRVSVSSAGTEANGDTYYSSISGDGNYIVFESNASNLIAGDNNGRHDVFLHDRAAGTTTLVSINAAGNAPGDYDSYNPAISADGGHVAFQSSATDLVAGDTNLKSDVFVRDLTTGVTTRVSLNTAGEEGDWDSYRPCISADGGLIAFESHAENLIISDTNGELDVFLRDTQNNITTRVSVASDGTQGDLQAYSCSISPDGRYIAFASTSTNLVAGDANDDSDIFIHDRQTSQTMLASIASDGTQGNSYSQNPSISSGGKHVAFDSPSQNLVSGDNNGEYTNDVFLHEVDLPSICDQVSEIPPSECLALEDLYNETNGDSWTDHTGWLITDTPCSWYGITCDSGHVTQVNLDYNNLSGTIPSGMEDLTQLQGLYLDGNQLTGSIPSELGNLSQLQYLYLGWNPLTGSIPSELGNLSQLQELFLPNTQISGSIPSELGNLSQLQHLYLDGNPLTGAIPSSLGNLSQLRELFLSSTQISGSIPSSLGDLSQLQILYLYDNQLTGTIPSTFGNLDALEILQLSTNQLSGQIPPELGGMASLAELHLDHNGFSGALPTELGSLTTLTILNLEVNQLRGQFPLSITNLVNLSSLSFDCQLSSTNMDVINFIEALVPGWQNSICPYVLSSTLVDPAPTGWGMVNFAVTFSEAVNGVEAGDFTLTQTGTLSGATVVEVTGGTTLYNVSVTTGTGEGLLRLDVVNSPSITNDSYGNAFQGSYTDGEAYLVDKTAPTVVSSALLNTPTTANANVQFLVTFTEAVENVTTADFGIEASVGITGASVTGVTGAGTGWTVTVNTGSGNGTLKLTVLANQDLTDLAGNALAADYLTGGYYTINKTLTWYSTAARDGYVLESTETSNVGATLNSTLTTFRLGDDATKKQYRGILSFLTSDLPDNAVITSVTLKIKQQGVTGAATFKMFQGLYIDIRKGTFGALGLEKTDFQATASKSNIGPYLTAPVGGWYTYNLTAYKAYINKLATGSGATQFRLRFKLDDNNNTTANYISFYSGNYATASLRPRLTIIYYVP